MTTSNAGNNVEKLGHSVLLVALEDDAATLENSMIILNKLTMKIPYGPECAVLGIYPREIKTYVHKKTFNRC